MTFLILFIFGIIIGSFLNVVSFRFKPGKKILGRQTVIKSSHCLSCKNVLRWYELIPIISFLIQGAKCKNCKAPISIQYPTIELLTGLITASIPLYFYQYFNVQFYYIQNQPIIWYLLFTALWLLISYTLIIISIIDFRFKIIPDQSNILLALLGLGIIFTKYSFSENFTNQASFSGPYSIVLAQSPSMIINLLISVIFAFIIFGGAIILTKGKGMGLGDLKMAIPLALILSWPDTIIAFSLSFIIGSIFGIMLLIGKIKKLKQGIPFGPFIALGAVSTIFYSESILRWYFTLVT